MIREGTDKSILVRVLRFSEDGNGRYGACEFLSQIG